MTVEDAAILRHWSDWRGEVHTVSQQTIDDVGSALSNSKDRTSCPLEIVFVGETITRDRISSEAIWISEQNGSRLRATYAPGSRLVAPKQPGYYRLRSGGEDVDYAVCPMHAKPLTSSGWGIAAQIYSLGKGVPGDLGDLSRLVEKVTELGGSAVAVNPVHAVHCRPDDHYSPYSPSSREWLNIDIIALPDARNSLPGSIIDWSAARSTRAQQLYSQFENSKMGSEFDEFKGAGQRSLDEQAIFDTLRQLRRDPFNVTPSEIESARTSRTAEFFRFTQWRASRDLASARDRKSALIGDLAVGVIRDGRDVWSSPGTYLHGLEIGCPPDRINFRGQKWGLTTYNPHALRRGGYREFIAAIRANMRHFDAIRIDHVMALDRIWVVPDGSKASEGAYVQFPKRDLIALVCLESWLNGCAIIGEDLGTLPDDCRSELERRGIYGLEVIRFRDAETLDPSSPAWQRRAVTMASTHDLATIHGWIADQDLEWLAKIGWLDRNDPLWIERKSEKQTILTKLGLQSNASVADVSSAIHKLMHANCSHLYLLQMEDLLEEMDQVNIPGTVQEHPNWSRLLLGWEDRLQKAWLPQE